MNCDVPRLIRALLTGGEANELESLLTEGVGLVRRPTITRRDAVRRRCSLTLLKLDDPLLANVDVCPRLQFLRWPRPAESVMQRNGVHPPVRSVCLRHPTVSALCFRAACQPRSFDRQLCPFVRTALVTRYLTNGLSNLDETYSEYYLSLMIPEIRLCRLKVKDQGHSRP